SVASLAGAATSQIALGDFTLTINGTSTTLFSGTISGNGALTKAGVGTIALAGNNTYTGATTLSGGTLAIGNGGTSGALGAGNITVSGPATLAFNRSDSLLISNTLSGSGAILQAGSGTTTLDGTNTNTGTVQATAGTLKFDGANALPSTITLLGANGATLSFSDNTARTTTLTTANLDLNNGAFVFDIGATSDTLVLGSGSASLTGTQTLNLNFLTTIISAQSWTLLNATVGGGL
ncbi:autotransporter-associated beta strand repeat-containing protein, partial [bacterium]|nr:autotransporter-associated beta strand repeat-containing protein [bacterium]